MNYESYLILMNGLILVLTDENPEIRAFVINQELNVLFSRELHLESPTLSKLTLYDTNDYVALDILFERLTEQVLTFKEIQMGSSALQLDEDALQEAVKNKKSVPSGFPGSDFYLTDIQVPLIFVENFLKTLYERSFYREHLKLNFDDKIFFHEPVNKFFDLLRVKKLVWCAI